MLSWIFQPSLFRRFHSIRKLQVNLITLRQQFIFCNLILLRAILDQALNVLFQVYYKDIGKLNIFNAWWLSFYLENIGEKKRNLNCVIHLIISGLRTIFNLKVYFDARRRLPEFTGLQGRRYPGQLAPRTYIVTPRRPDLPEEHREDWRRIGSKRANTITITVSPPDEGEEKLVETPHLPWAIIKMESIVKTSKHGENPIFAKFGF